LLPPAGAVVDCVGVGVEMLDELGVAVFVSEFVLVLDDGVVVVDVVVAGVDAREAVWVTPTTIPTVAREAPAAVLHPIARERRSRRSGKGFAFMPTTMRRRGSGPHQRNVKPVLRPGVNQLRAV